MGEHHANQEKVMQTNLRIEALRLAVGQTPVADEAVAKAAAYYEFLKGGG